MNEQEQKWWENYERVKKLYDAGADFIEISIKTNLPESTVRSYIKYIREN